MRLFSQLSKRGQARRLAALARAALPAWSISPVRLRLLNLGHNATFRVDAADGEPYVLRVHRPGWQTDAAIGSEMDWLAAIRAETDMIVPKPVQTRTGEWLTQAQADGVPEERQCVLFHWVSGRFRRRQAGAASLEKVGELMARLHNHAQSWTPPADFTRKRWDADGLLGLSLGVNFEESVVRMQKDDQRTAREMAARLRAETGAWDNGPETFGLIHADLHFGNVLFEKGGIRAIDFDDCGWGWHGYDMAVPLAWLAGRPDMEKLRAAFVNGYRRVRRLTVESEARLPLFIAARHLTNCLWLESHWEEPQFQRWIGSHIVGEMSRVRQFLETGK